MKITGVDVVTVGVPYGFECSADCSPPCTYTWNLDGQIVHGSGLDFVLHDLTPPQDLNCVAKNPTTGKTVSVDKIVNVAGTVVCGRCLLTKLSLFV